LVGGVDSTSHLAAVASIERRLKKENGQPQKGRPLAKRID
jgi:hypothetical protein